MVELTPDGRRHQRVEPVSNFGRERTWQVLAGP